MEREDYTFEQLAEPLRREIKLHCYRMSGSIAEADDLTQETYLRAWRSFSSFDGRSFRAWLYRIATNACLNELAGRKSASRWLPDQLAPSTLKMPDGMPATDVSWLEPYPDSNLDWIPDCAPNPLARFTSQEAVKLAFVAAIQQLPPRQRAVLLLCDVLGWAASEAAALLDGSTASINSALQRARKTLAKRYRLDGRKASTTSRDLEQELLLGRYLKAWEGHDLDGFVALLKEDATYSMPPWQQWYAGPDAIRSFFVWAWESCSGLRLLPTAANGQPAFAVYAQVGDHGKFIAHSIHVLAFESGMISALTMFVPPTGPRLFDAFGLPLDLDNSSTTTTI